MSFNMKPVILASTLAVVTKEYPCLQNFGSRTFVAHGITGVEEISVEIKWGVGDADFEQATDADGADIKLTSTVRSVTVYGPAIVRLNKPTTSSAVTVSYLDAKGV